jgi:hypothetical protein
MSWSYGPAIGVSPARKNSAALLKAYNVASEIIDADPKGNKLDAAKRGLEEEGTRKRKAPGADPGGDLQPADHVITEYLAGCCVLDRGPALWYYVA